MKVELDYDSLSLWQVIASHFPFKSKKYIAKWARLRANKDTFNHVLIWCDEDGILKADIQINLDISTMFVWMDLYKSPICTGISMRDLWDNLLKRIAIHENMRNAEELCIWLDMQPQ